MPDAREENMGEGFDEKHRIMVDQITESARGIGLYLDAAWVAPLTIQHPSGNIVDPDKLMVTAVFTIGDQAWTTQMMDPEQHAVNEQFQDLTIDMDVTTESILDDLRNIAEGGSSDGT